MTDHVTRRNLLATSSRTVAAGALLAGMGTRLGAFEPAISVTLPSVAAVPGGKDWLEPGQPGTDYIPVVVPNGKTLPWRVVDGVKVYHLIAQEVPGHEFAPGLVADCWGYNGVVHGPVIEAVEGTVLCCPAAWTALGVCRRNQSSRVRPSSTNGRSVSTAR